MESDPDREALDSLDLVRQAQSGRDEAYSRLFERYYGRVHRIVRRRLGPNLRRSMESVDIVQDAMVDAIRGFERFEIRDRRALIAWFATLVENRIRAASKRVRAVKRDKDREVETRQQPASESRSGLDLPSDDPAPLDQLSDLEQADILQSCLAELDERFRRVIVLRHQQSASWESIAVELGKPSADAARMLYARAKIELRKRLRQRLPDSEDAT